MLYSVVICALTCMLLILAVLFVPKIKIGSWAVDLYWVVALAGAVAMVLAKQLDVDVIDSTLAADTVINPLKILVLFLSMTILSIYLDELGFFSYLADKTLEKTGASQLRLFVYLYCIVSLLTVSLQTTSSFFRLRLSSAILPRTHVSVLCLIWLPNLWPLICYFAKNARISAMSYLAAEFVAANTWNMALIIGNPTNIYLATANGIGFFAYLKVMALPTIAAGTVALLLL